MDVLGRELQGTQLTLDKNDTAIKSILKINDRKLKEDVATLRTMIEEQFAITGVCATFPPDNTSKELRCPRSHYGTPYSHYTLISLCDSACMFA